jgi:hypothetical protein
MIHRLGILTALIFAGLAALHLFWAAGGRWGGAAAIPTAAGGGRRILHPSPLGTVAVAAALSLAMLVVLVRVGVWAAPLPGWLFKWAAWGIALAFLARGVGEFRYVGLFKRVRGTDFALWDTWLFTPLCLFIAAAVVIINLATSTDG